MEDLQVVYQRNARKHINSFCANVPNASLIA